MNDIQKVIYDIFLEVKKLCDDNGIRYYAIGGTCIGAVRHNGFIPWDDDLDIAIPIEEFDRFLQIAKKKLPDHLELYTCDEIQHYKYIFAKVVDKRTTFIENADMPYPDAYKGIYVDIMPISGVPDEGSERIRFLKKIHWYTTCNSKIRFPLSAFKKWEAKALWFVIHPLKIIFSFRHYSDKYLDMLRKYPVSESNYVGYVWSLWIDRLIFPKKWFDGVDELKFEQTTMSCPIDWNNYLTLQFHDYMKLPPKEDQVGHHDGIVNTKKTYIEYKKKGILK